MSTNNNTPIRRASSLQTSRVLQEMFCWSVVLSFAASYQYGGLIGLNISQLFGVGSVILDYYISPTFKSNLDNLTSRGYTYWTIFVVMIFSLLSSSTAMALIMDYFDCFNVKPHWDLELIFVVLSNLTLAELCFTFSHTLLHQTEWGAKYHHMHHCCRPCSWSSNLIFHPIDLFLEFAGPVLSVTISHAYLFQDAFSFLVSVHLIHFWYAVDHSENLKLHHYNHHKYIDTYYSIYVPVRASKFGDTSTSRTEKDCVKKILHE